MTDTAAIEALRRQLLATPGWFPAVYAGTCGGCGRRYRPSDALRLPMPQRLGWIAQCCAEPSGEQS